ncbi:MAG: hypothetical protein HZB56_18715 [Deltaproteobacteria bacterium]|nr:hypothetical protein [Deltaproteobacteria bacterium]
MTHVPASRDQVVAVVESINQPQISIPTKVPQAAQAHLVGLRNGNGTFSIYVGLFLRQTGENVIYSHDRREIPVESYPELEHEALQFLESMGFMLDNTHFRNQAPEAQEQILRRVPIFSRPRPAAAAAGEAKSGPRQALARLLAGI